MTIKLCERCQAESVDARERYCVSCRKVVRKELRESGYLQSVPRRAYRSPEQAQAHGDGGPWGENAVRALEDG